MAMSNPSNYLQHALETSWSIDFIKSIIAHPGPIPSHVFAQFNSESSMEDEFSVKFLQDIYNPPENNMNLSQQKMKDLQTMRLKHRYQQNQIMRETSRKVEPQWNSSIQGAPINRMLNRNPGPVGNKFVNGSYPQMTDYFMTNIVKNKPGFFNPGDPMLNQKRKMDTSILYDASKKKFRGTRNILTKNVTKEAKFIDLVEDDLGSGSLVGKKNKKENKTTKYKHLAPTGLNKSKSITEPIEILDISDSDESINQENPSINLDLLKSNETLKYEEKQVVKKSEEIVEREEPVVNENTNEEGLNNDEDDTFNFDLEDLGIKILGEVFLCNRCQKEISKKDVDKGFKETCPPCSKIISKPPKKKQQATVTAEIPVKPQVEQASTTTRSTQPTQTIQLIQPVQELAEEANTCRVLAPLYQSRGFYEEAAQIDILDPLQHKRSTMVGKNRQITKMPLTLYNTAGGRKTRKLWKPDRIDISIYERLKNDINTKNSVYLIDEEVTEILVRHKYNAEQALDWCAKTNPEFQYYVKRSSNRKRLISRGAGKNEKGTG